MKHHWEGVNVYTDNTHTNIKINDSLACSSVHHRQTWRNTGPNSTVADSLQSLEGHKAFSAFVFTFRQTCISRDLDIRFLTPLLRCPQTENMFNKMPEMRVLPVCPQLLVWGKDRLPLSLSKRKVVSHHFLGGVKVPPTLKVSTTPGKSWKSPWICMVLLEILCKMSMIDHIGSQSW